jgi:Putative peptidoglycan binding domain
MTTPTYLRPPLDLSIDDFRSYVAKLQFGSWKPTIPYLHNTGVPSLKQVAEGKAPEEKWAVNLESYYKGLGWHAGPHCIAMPDGVVVLSDLTKPGVAESCSNDIAFGLEMLGNFEVGGDDFSTGNGALVREMAAQVLAIMADKIGWGNLADYVFNVRGLHFHHDCVQDHHACPGSKVTKPDMLNRIAGYRSGRLVVPPPAPPAPVQAPPALNSVEDIQAALNRLGILPNEVPDGSYGPVTRARVKLFQDRAHCSMIDGWVGPETTAAMLAALSKLKG